MNKNIKKYVYIKNGNIIDQLHRILPSRDNPPTSGPDAFLADLILSLENNPLLLISYFNENNKYSSGNITAIEYNCRRKGSYIRNRISHALRNAKSAFVLLGDLLSFHPDVIICGRVGMMLWISFLVSRIYNIPFIHSRHIRIDRDDVSSFKTIDYKMNQWVIKHTSACICHGPYTRQQLIDDGYPSSKILEFDISLKDFISEADKVTTENQNYGLKTNIYILFVGRMEESKGIFDLLQASSEFLQNDNISLVFAGEGKDLDALSRRVIDMGLENKVHILGSVKHSQLLPLYRGAKIVVAPTRYAKEGRCMSVMEALVTGIPVIAPNGGPFPYLVKHEKNGLLFTINSIKDMNKQIKRALYDTNGYSILKKGAIESGLALIEPELTFSNAIMRAIKLSSK